MKDRFDRRKLLAFGAQGAAIAGLIGAAKPAAAADSGPVEQGSTWSEFTRLVGELGGEISAPGVPAREIDRAEGYRLFTRYLTCGLDYCLEYADPAYPAFFSFTRDGVRKYAGDNPDELYGHATVSPEYAYRIVGNIKETLLLECGVYSGNSFLDPTAKPVRLLTHLTEETLQVEADGRFEIFLGGPARAKNWLPLDPTASSLLVRRYLRDPLVDRPRALIIERLGGDFSPPPLTEAVVREGLLNAAKWARVNARIWADYVNRTKARKLNVLVGFEDNGELGAPAGHNYLEGYWAVPDGKALVLSFDPPKARYWNILAGNYWMESLEWRFGNGVNFNNLTSKVGKDGRVTYAIAHERPARPDVNWFETLGHYEGQMCLRAARMTAPLAKVDARLVDLKDV